MATLVFTAVGTAIGGPIGGAIGSILGQQVDNTSRSSGAAYTRRSVNPRDKSVMLS